MKHIHADVIHAWANGAKVQHRPDDSYAWKDITSPAFDPYREYRIKPEEKKKVTRWIWALNDSLSWYKSSCFYTEEEAKKLCSRKPLQKLEWSATEFEE